MSQTQSDNRITNARLPGSTAIPDSPDALLSDVQLSAALAEMGLRVSPATLQTKRTRGGGPTFCKFGPRALYRWADGLAWAQARLSPPRQSTSEADVARGAAS